MGYRLNRLDEPVFMAVSKPLLTEFGINHRFESCVPECMTLAEISATAIFFPIKLMHDCIVGQANFFCVSIFKLQSGVWPKI